MSAIDNYSIKLYYASGISHYDECGEMDMEAAVWEYDAKLDSKKRLTLREAEYEYYHVSVLPDQRIVLGPRVLTKPSEVSANTLKMMDSADENMKQRKVSHELDLSEFEE